MVLEGLSPREQQVAQMVADSMSNKDIAYALGMTTFKVKRCLTHIYRKTGLISAGVGNSRVALARKVLGV